MARLQIYEPPSMLLPEKQILNSQGQDLAWHGLTIRMHWMWYASCCLVVGALSVIVLVTMQVNSSNSGQPIAPHNERIVKLTAAIKHTPDDPALYWMLGDAYFDQEDYAQALANYHRYLELAPANPPQRLLQRLTYLEFHILKK